MEIVKSENSPLLENVDLSDMQIVFPKFSSYNQPGGLNVSVLNEKIITVESSKNLSLQFSISQTNLNILLNGFIVFTLDDVIWYASDVVYINDLQGNKKSNPVLFLLNQITLLTIPAPINLKSLKVRFGFVKDKSLLSTYIKSSSRIPDILSNELITISVVENIESDIFHPGKILPIFHSFESKGIVYPANQYVSNYNINTDILKLIFYWPSGSSDVLDSYYDGSTLIEIFNNFIFTADDLHWEYDNNPKTNYTRADGSKTVSDPILYVPPFNYVVTKNEDYYTITFSSLGIGDRLNVRIGLIDSISLKRVQSKIKLNQIEYKVYSPTNLLIDSDYKQRNKVDDHLLSFVISYAENNVNNLLDPYLNQVTETPRPSSVTATPQPTQSHTPTPTVTPTISITPTVSVTPTRTPTPTPTITVTPTRTLTPTPTVTVTPTVTITPSINTTPTPTISLTPSITKSPLISPTPTASIGSSRTPTPTPTITPSVSLTPTVSIGSSKTPTPTPTVSIGSSPTPSVSASTIPVTPTPTPTFTPTPSVSVTGSNTPTPTPTPSQTPSNSITPTPTPTLPPRPETSKKPSVIVPTPTPSRVLSDFDFNTISQGIKTTFEFFTNKDSVSPILDLQKMSYTLVNNIINSLKEEVQIETELQPSGGFAKSRYITKPVKLNSDTTASKIFIAFAANIPEETFLRIYYKVYNSIEDPKSSLDKKRWIAVGTSESVKTFEESSFIDFEFNIDEIDYDGNYSIKEFDMFTIKIVKESSNEAIVPRIKDFRVVALS